MNFIRFIEKKAFDEYWISKYIFSTLWTFSFIIITTTTTKRNSTWFYPNSKEGGRRKSLTFDVFENNSGTDSGTHSSMKIAEKVSCKKELNFANIKKCIRKSFHNFAGWLVLLIAQNSISLIHNFSSFICITYECTYICKNKCIAHWMQHRNVKIYIEYTYL